MSINLQQIKIVGFDVDGVLTDGRIIHHANGDEAKNFHSRDGLGIKILIQAGLEVVLITARKSAIVQRRADELGIGELHQNALDKWPIFEDILKRRGLGLHEAAFAGDDLIDLPIMRRVALAMAPSDASPEVLSLAHFVSSAKGGHGAARQMVEYILKGQGRWAEVVARYLL